MAWQPKEFRRQEGRAEDDGTVREKVVEDAGRRGVARIEHGEREDWFPTLQVEGPGPERRVREGAGEDRVEDQLQVQEALEAVRPGERLADMVEEVDLPGAEKQVLGQGLGELGTGEPADGPR